MRISAIRVIELRGTARLDGPLGREPLGKPADVYPEYRSENRGRAPEPAGPRSVHVHQRFLQIETDEGLCGRVGPVEPQVACLARSRLGGHLLGEDPLAVERLWDVMFRTQAHGGAGLLLHAIGAVDCALWDLKGKWASVPVYRLLGGPTRDAIDAYAQTKGMSHHPDHLVGEARRLVDDGWRRLKVFLGYGPADGPAGMQRNVDVVRTLREGLGDEVEIMADAWRAWDYGYARDMLRRLAPFGLRWMEEPLPPEPVSALARLRGQSPVPIAAGEHAGGRWGHKRLLDAAAVDVLQPDVCWAGGISETRKVVALASAAGVEVCPHTHLLPPTVHLLAGTSPGEATLLEFPVFQQNYMAAFFLKDPPRAERGAVALPPSPGLGMEWDESKIESQEEISCSD
jgi:L-alanine-DL-glutamate epimerase-like enolase superfamily enzyme